MVFVNDKSALAGLTSTVAVSSSPLGKPVVWCAVTICLIRRDHLGLVGKRFNRREDSDNLKLL